MMHDSRGLTREQTDQCLHEVGDRHLLQTLDRSYAVGPDRPGGEPSLYDAAIPPWQGPLTITLATDGIGQTVIFDIREDLKTIRPAPRQVCLRIRLAETAAGDEISFVWNDQVMQPQRIDKIGVLDYWEDYEFDLTPNQVVAGQNSLTIRLDRRSDRMPAFVKKEEAELTVRV